MSRGVPLTNLIRRAAARLSRSFETIKAAQEAMIEEVRKEVTTITGRVRSSIDAHLARRRVHWRTGGRKPHQGLRECARRRGDWQAVSMIDALKRYPYGINHRFPSINRPDRTELPDRPLIAVREPQRIVVPR